MKRGHKSINTSDTNMVDEYEGRGVFDSELTTILLSEKIFAIDILNKTAGSCYDWTWYSRVKIRSNVILSS